MVADTFLVAWRRLDEVPADALPWLYGVARRVLANHRRAARRTIALSERAAALKGSHRDDWEAVDDQLSILSALATLNQKDREVLSLIVWEGLDASRASQVLGCSKAAVAVRLHRARKRLGRALHASASEHPQPTNSPIEEAR